MHSTRLKHLAAAFLACFTLATLAFAAPPKTISYQGYLTDSAGLPITAISPKKSIGFALYSTTTGKTPLWNESQSVAVDKGIYKVELGSAADLTLPFDTQYYLGVTVDPDTVEMSPRQALTGVPYTFRAKLADGVSLACAEGGVLIYRGGKWQCGTITTYPNAAATCVSPTDCIISMCSPGYGNCNESAPDGCEVDLRTTLSNCGTCGNICPAFPNRGNSCSAGACSVGACFTNYGDCNGMPADGCEASLLTDPNNCNACGNDCGPEGICSAGTCQPFGTQANPAQSCKELKRINPALVTSTVYWIKLGAVDIIPVFCDMVTDGGGWTMWANFLPPPAPASAVTPTTSDDAIRPGSNSKHLVLGLYNQLLAVSNTFMAHGADMYNTDYFFLEKSAALTANCYDLQNPAPVLAPFQNIDTYFFGFSAQSCNPLSQPLAFLKFDSQQFPNPNLSVFASDSPGLWRMGSPSATPVTGPSIDGSVQALWMYLR